MGRAMLSAGLEPPDVKLDRLIVEAIGRTSDSSAAIRSQVMGAVRHDLSLLWELTKDTHITCLNSRVQKMRDKIALERARSKEAQKSSGGQQVSAAQARAAPRSAGNGSSAASAPKPAAQPAPAPKHMTAGEARAHGFRAANEYALRVVCHLDTFMLNGKKLRDCTVAEAMEWAKAEQEAARTHASGARFVLRLSSGMPSNAVFGDYWKGKDGDVNDIFVRVQKEYEGWV